MILSFILFLKLGCGLWNPLFLGHMRKVTYISWCISCNTYTPWKDDSCDNKVRQKWKWIKRKFAISWIFGIDQSENTWPIVRFELRLRKNYRCSGSARVDAKQIDEMRFRPTFVILIYILLVYIIYKIYYYVRILPIANILIGIFP